MNALPYKYLVSFRKDGKVIESEFCNTLAEIKVLQAIAHSKGCLCEAHKLYEEKPVCVNEQHAKQETTVARPRWKRRCKCVETGKVYNSVRECSNDTGIKYRAIINCLRCGSSRNGLHFTYDFTSDFIPIKTHKRKGRTKQRFICVSTGQIFDSLKLVLAKYDIPQTSFYRALALRKPVKGLLFDKV